MKTGKSLFILFFSSLFFSSCTDVLPNEDIPDSPIRWKANFKVRDKDIPIIFTLDSIPLNSYGLRTIFIDGPIKNQKEYIRIENDSFINPLDFHRESHLKGIIKADTIKGIYEDKKNKDTTLIAPFTAYKTYEPRFSSPSAYTDVSVTGTWELVFVPNKTSPKFTLYQASERFYFYQIKHTLIARTPRSEGFEGVMTENGFRCSSLSRNRPTLLEAELIDHNLLKGTITTPDHVFEFIGHRKSKLERSTEDGSTFLKLLRNLFKAYQEYP